MPGPINRYDRPMRQVSTVSVAMLAAALERAQYLLSHFDMADHAECIQNLQTVVRSCREALESGDDLVFPFDAD